MSMKASEIKIGERYIVRQLPLEETTIVVRVDEYDGAGSYTCTDGETGQTVIIRGSTCFVCPVHPMNPGQEALDGVSASVEPNTMPETIECRHCKRRHPAKEGVCVDCYDRAVESLAEVAAALPPSEVAIAPRTKISAIEVIRQVTWRAGALIVLWQVLSHVGGLLEGVLHWKWVTLLGA